MGGFGARCSPEGDGALGEAGGRPETANLSSRLSAAGGEVERRAATPELLGFDSRGSAMKTAPGSPRDTTVRRGEHGGHTWACRR